MSSMARKVIYSVGDLECKVGHSSPCITIIAAIVGKFWLWGKWILNIRKKNPFPCKISVFWLVWVHQLGNCGPKNDFESARLRSVCRTGSSLRTHILAYTWKTLV